MPTTTVVSEVHPVLLRGMEKSNNLITPAAAPPSTPNDGGTTGEQPARDNDAHTIRTQLAEIFTGCSQLDAAALHRHLADPTDAVRPLLDAWAKCGRGDRSRTLKLQLTPIAKRTMTPLGLACLVRYARAWLDAHEEAELLREQSVRSLKLSEGGGSRRPRQGPKKRTRDQATGRRRR